MIQLTKTEEKQQIANKIKSLVEEVNTQIHLANDLFLNIYITQNPKMGSNNSDVSVSISESVSY